MQLELLNDALLLLLLHNGLQLLQHSTPTCVHARRPEKSQSRQGKSPDDKDETIPSLKHCVAGHHPTTPHFVGLSNLPVRDKHHDYKKHTHMKAFQIQVVFLKVFI